MQIVGRCSCYALLTSGLLLIGGVVPANAGLMWVAVGNYEYVCTGTPTGGGDCGTDLWAGLATRTDGTSVPLYDVWLGDQYFASVSGMVMVTHTTVPAYFRGAIVLDTVVLGRGFASLPTGTSSWSSGVDGQFLVTDGTVLQAGPGWENIGALLVVRGESGYVVPEPSSMTLVALGIFLIVWRFSRGRWDTTRL